MGRRLADWFRRGGLGAVALAFLALSLTGGVVAIVAVEHFGIECNGEEAAADECSD